MDLVEFLKPVGRQGRSDRPYSTRTGIPRTDIGKFSFINRTSNDWNKLPTEIFANNPSLPCFKGRLRSHLLLDN